MPTNKVKSAPTKAKKRAPKNTKFLDRLHIPGMSPAFKGYDGGIPKWLIQNGLSVTVQKNWFASVDDKIEVIDFISMRTLAEKTLKAGEENNNIYSFSIPQSSLTDGDAIWGYRVTLKGGPDNELSYPLTVLVKTTIPAGPDRDLIAPGHSELKHDSSDLEIREIQAGRGVILGFDPYPNMHDDDLIECQFGSLFVTPQKVAGVGKRTEIKLNRDQLIEVGNGSNRMCSFQSRDLVGNVSTPRSKNIAALVEIGSADLAAPIFSNQHIPGLIDLEALNGEKLHLRLFTYAWEGLLGFTYFVTFRGFPKLGGVVLEEKYIPIEAVGRPHDFFVPNEKVQACAGGKVDISFILFNGLERVAYSKIASAAVVDAIVRLQRPFFVRYPFDVVDVIPRDGAAIEIPDFIWRKANDQILLLLRYVIPGSNELIVYEDKFTVGPVPEGVPIRRLIPYEALLKFDGLDPELYYVHEPAAVAKQHTASINESIRAKILIGPQG